jgi:hypothetical protein
MPKAGSNPQQPGDRLQLKVTLLDLRPAIWRRLLVPAAIKLPKFHTVLQLAFGWTNSHLHAFRHGEDSYETDHRSGWVPDLFNDGSGHDEKKVRLGDLLQARGDWLLYEYDFGESWEHEVLIEKVLPGTGTSHAVCLAGARAGPPEDCGGVPGYENVVTAMADPKHPEREELLEWLGAPYDAKAFDCPGLNRQLKRLKL